jgi:8-oxo-dGTP pyrophosphatase MutT (NUDIX family)
MARSGNHARAQHQACAVPYRLADQRVEFCLYSVERTSRWEFPYTAIAPGESPAQAACRAALESTGLVCRHTDQSLEDVTATQNRRLVRLTSFLLEVESAAADGGSVAAADTGPPDAAMPRTRWCFAEEARARIRRKPMRRLIDLALRSLGKS